MYCFFVFVSVIFREFYTLGNTGRFKMDIINRANTLRMRPALLIFRTIGQTRVRLWKRTTTLVERVAGQGV